MKKIGKIVSFCVVSALALSACNKYPEPAMIESNPDIQGDYILEELDNVQTGIGIPGGLCIYESNIYVCDIENNCIVKLNEELQKVESYGTLGMENGNFSEPADITFSGNYFYVLDSGNNRVQKFASDFSYLETYYLEPLLSEQGYGQYLSIAVDEDGTIYVTAISPDNKDAYIYYLENGEWEKAGENVVGYLCEGNGEVYFANVLEFHIEEKKTSIESGKNILYKIEEEELRPMVRFIDMYAPVALTCWNDCIYMVSAGNGVINFFSQDKEMMDTLQVLPEFSLYMYMEIDAGGNIYITDSENGNFYYVY